MNSAKLTYLKASIKSSLSLLLFFLSISLICLLSIFFLTPLKSIYNFNAINITLGLPFIRISPDHGPNDKMIGKNKSNPESLIAAIKFLDNS